MGVERVRVGAAASAAGVGVQTLHFYEREGLIERPGRSPSGYRKYPQSTVERVRAIKRAQSLGFTLREIRALIGLAEDHAPIDDVSAVAQARLAEIDAQIEALQDARAGLVRVLEHCSCGGDVALCDLVQGLEAGGNAGEESGE
jgi:MerR family copper efflux transcriptional regulator